MAMVRFKCCFVFILRQYSDLVVSGFHVQLGESLSPMKFIQKLIHNW
jgi:hypothetical protein